MVQAQKKLTQHATNNDLTRIEVVLTRFVVSEAITDVSIPAAEILPNPQIIIFAIARDLSVANL